MAVATAPSLWCFCFFSFAVITHKIQNARTVPWCRKGHDRPESDMSLSKRKLNVLIMGAVPRGSRVSIAGWRTTPPPPPPPQKKAAVRGARGERGKKVPSMRAEDFKLWVRRVLAEKKCPVYQGNDCRCNRDATRLNCEWPGTKLSLSIKTLRSCGLLNSDETPL